MGRTKAQVPPETLPVENVYRGYTPCIPYQDPMTTVAPFCIIPAFCVFLITSELLNMLTPLCLSIPSWPRPLRQTYFAEVI
jgi:hypothetical protein